MVVSSINTKVTYSERMSIEETDMESDPLPVFSTMLHKKRVEVVVGHAKYDHLSDRIVYYPLYLATNTNKFVQIGVYEFNPLNIPTEDADSLRLNLEKVSKLPVLYSYTTPVFLKTNAGTYKPAHMSHTHTLSADTGDVGSAQPDESIDIDSVDMVDDNPIPMIRRDTFKHMRIQLSPKLRQETAEEARHIRHTYTKQSNDLWIHQFMKNRNYNILDNESSGECLFYVIRDAFQSIGQSTTVEKLRSLVASKVTEDVYNGYKDQYTMFVNAIEETTRESIKLKNDKTALKNDLQTALGEAERDRILAKSKQIDERYKELKNQNESSKALLADVRFMKNINSMSEFRNLVRSCNFWADAWTLSTIEVVLNIKFIVLSADIYKEKDYPNVLKCDHIIDPVLKSRGEFNPEFYIIVEHVGKHYRLISYNDRSILTFKEIPYDLKRMIVEKCMEGGVNVFHLIKLFKVYQSDTNVQDPKLLPSHFLEEGDHSDLYTDDIVLSFYSNSASKPFPGKGSGETISKEDIPKFFQLSKIENWRRMLDRDWVSSFYLDGKEWASVEHFVQASKFKKHNPEFYEQFSLDTDNDLSKNVEMAKSAGSSKSGKFAKVQVRPKGVAQDPDFYPIGEEEAVKKATYAKFSQKPDLKKMLIHTGNAKIVRYQKGSEPDIMVVLMEVRRKLMLENM